MWEIVVGLRFLIFASIVIWCVVIPGYKAASRTVGIGVGAVCALIELTAMCDFYYGDTFLAKINMVDYPPYSNIIEFVIAICLLAVVWKTHVRKYKIVVGIIGILNVLIGIASQYVCRTLIWESIMAEYREERWELEYDLLCAFKSIGLIITLIVIWVMLIRFLQTNSNGKHSSSVIVCPACGARMEEQLNFCPKCGYRFK